MTAPAVGAQVRIEWLPGSERSAAGELWRAIEARLPDARLAYRWDWVETWLEQYADLVPHRFALGSADGAPIALALITEATERRGPVRVRTLHLGTAGEPPGEGVYVSYNGLLAEPAHVTGFAGALVAALRADRAWDQLVLDRFATDETALFEGLPRMSASVEQAPAVDLTAAAAEDGDVLATLRPRTRQQVRRSLRLLGDTSIEVAGDQPTADAILDELIELHQARWEAAGARGAFASRRFTEFQRALVRRLLPSGGVMLFRVRARGETVGCIYNLVDGDHVLSYLQGFASFSDGKLKPGFVAHTLCMQACQERGLATYDLLPEASAYKLELSNSECQLVSGRLSRRRPGLLLANMARRAKRYGGALGPKPR